MEKTTVFILTSLILLILFGGIALPATADVEPITPVTAPQTNTLTAPPSTVPAPEPTTVPTVEPTTLPTTEPTTIPPTTPAVITTETTTIPTGTEPTEEPTITIIPGGGKGYIDTYCNVDGASVSFDGRYECTIAQGVCTVGVSPTGYVSTVTVSMPGYVTWSGPLSGMPADKQHVAVYATLNPVPTQTPVPPPQNGAIYTQSNPAGASIYLNGNLQGYSPFTIPNLPQGTYSLKASLSGYSPDTQLVDVYSGRTSTYYPNLQPSPPPPRNTGTVSVASSPGAALIYVDSNYQGKTPLTVTLYPGTHNFRIGLSGYTDYTTSVYVSANTNQKLDARMTPAIFGTVALSSVPGATVWMDSNSQGKIPSTGTLTLPGITGGNHVFRVTAAGYTDWINTVYVQPNEVTPVSVAMTPSGGPPTPVPATGGFNIVSTPSGAEILIDNVFRGYTPSVLDGISAGQHQVLLKYTGFMDYSTTAPVNAGQTTPLAIGMQPAPTPTPESAPSLPYLVGEIALILGIGVLSRRRS